MFTVAKMFHQHLNYLVNTWFCVRLNVFRMRVTPELMQK